MPSVAVDPHDKGHVVVAYMDYSLVTTGYAGIGVAVSIDNGVTWQRTLVPLPAGFDQGASNPTAQFDDRGHVFISFMAATYLGPIKPPITSSDGGAARGLGFQANNGIFVSRSDDGGLTWQSPAAIVSHIYDGSHKVPFEVAPTLAIDSSSASPLDGALYVTWNRFYPAGQFPGQPNAQGGSDVMFATSITTAAERFARKSWTVRTQTVAGVGSVTVLEDTARTVTPELAWPRGSASIPTPVHVTVGPDGSIYVSEFRGALFTVNVSRNAGMSFFVTRDPTQGLPFGLGSKQLEFGLSNNQFRILPTRAIAADPAHPGRV